MTPQHAVATALALAVLLLQTGCGKTDKSGNDSPPGGASAGGAAGVAGIAGTAGTGSQPPRTCTDPHPGPYTAGRLGNYELNRSFTDLLRGLPQAAKLEPLPEQTWDEDPESDVSDQYVVDLHRAAHTIASRLSEDEAALRSLSGCDVATRGEDTCRDQLIARFVERAYRRPLTDEDRNELLDVFASGKALGGNFGSGARALLEVTLQNPDFVYLLEQGSGEAAGDSVALTGYESAALLANFLTGSLPDDELFAAAQRGLDPAELETQARRLLGSLANRERVRHLYGRLWHLNALDPVPELAYTAEIAALTQEETARFVDDVTFDGAGTFRALLTESSTWVNAPLAQFYGYPGVSGDAFQKLQLDPGQRLGIFTQSTFLRSTSYGTHTSPVRRGLAVLQDVLCYQIPPPPANVPPLPPELPMGATTRQRLEQETSSLSCQPCHHDINPLGFAFEHYDSVGRWRDTENGAAIDSSGELYRTDAKGRFSDAVELMKRIAESDDAKACFVGHWLSQANRRREATEDACTKADVVQAFADADGNVVELLVALAKTDNFRYRLRAELQP